MSTIWLIALNTFLAHNVGLALKKNNLASYVVPFNLFLFLMHSQAQIRQQGDDVTVHLDMIIGFGSWDFSPLDLENPFPNNEGSVHLWHGDHDLMVPVSLQRYIAKKLPWIHYHEVPAAGHLFAHGNGYSDAIIKALLLGEK